MHQAINREDDEEVRTELRQLIDRAALIPLEGPGQFQLEVHDSCLLYTSPSPRDS